MKVGSIVKASFTQSDGKIKSRPAVLLKIIPPFDDFLICAISSQTRHYVQGLDIMIDSNHKDFSQSGLKLPGIIRSAMTITVPSEIIEGAIGELSHDTYSQLMSQLIDFLKRDSI